MNTQSSSTYGFDSREIRSLRQQIVNQIDDRIAGVLASLPAEYFQQMGDAERLEHFKALVAIKVCDIDQEITLRQQDGSRVSVISSVNYPGQLARLIKDLPDDFPLVGAQIFTSADQGFIVDVFEFQTAEVHQEERSETLPDNLNAAIEQVIAITGHPRSDIEIFIKRYHQNHQILESPEEIAHQYVALKETEHINDIKVLWKETLSESGSAKRIAKVTISAASSTTRAIFLRAATYFGRYNYDIRRALCENVIVRDTIDVALLTFHVAYNAAGEQSLKPSHQLCRDLETYLRLDEEVVAPALEGQASLLDTFGDIELAELFCAMGRLTQHAVNFSQPQEVSHERVVRVLLKKHAFVKQVLTHFQNRFKSDEDASSGTAESEAFESNLEAISGATDQSILRKFVQLTLAIQRSNIGFPKRRGLAVRVPGNMFENSIRGETPFAVFYVFGCGFDGFHVRFRDVARGGMRLVPTRNQEHYLFESSRVFDEAWRLASAQQLKNKDIAEGGAKAVVVIKPETDSQKAGRDFVDGLLDLIIDPRATSARDQPEPDNEYLYLGPDENVSNELINWIVERSSDRKYEFPSTIMSSKPVSGINHKKYGVTSEGVVIFLRHALIESGIDPDRQPFTIKLTGGPDGDVGGNAIRILIRDYANQVKFVGISDGTGSAIDEQGLDHVELIRLVENGLGIVHFAPNQLSSRGSVMGLDNEQQIARRNQLHNEVLADVFLPAGGRPSTLNETNWRDFLDPQGNPSSRIVVEGANLFLTEQARTKLSEAGVVIVKDSSANKCGVICSSLEIIAGMLLSEDQFIRIKPTYITEVLELLRELARTEAISLFNEQLRRPDLTLPEISVLISRQIIRVADVIHDSFSDWSPAEQRLADRFIDCFLPSSLAQQFDGTLSDRIPANYRKHLIGAILSSRIVYREGIPNLFEMKDKDLQQLVRANVVYESRVQEMIGQLTHSGLPDKDLIIQILEHSGARGQRELKTPKS